MSQQVCFLPSPEVIAALSDNQVDLASELRRLGIRGTVEYRDDPAASIGSQTREPVTAIMLAAGVSALFVAQAISRIIQQVQNKPVLTATMTLQAIREADGTVARHHNGAPVLFWVEQPILTEPATQNPSFEAEMNLPFGIKVSLETDAKRK
jgi:hypothetical protein